MSRGAVQVVRHGIEAWNAVFNQGADPLTALREFCDPDIEIDFSRRLVDAETYRGYGGAQRFLEQLREPWEEFRIEVGDCIDTGEKVAIIGQLIGRARQSGVTIDSEVAQLCTVRDGRITRIEYFGDDRAGCLTAAGISL
jgi:ketosteroid isomerase-like protein